MRIVIATLILSLGANAFAPMALSRSYRPTSQFAKKGDEVASAAEATLIAEKKQQMATDAERWRSIKLMTAEEAETSLEGEWLEAYKSFHAQVKEDLDRMSEIAKMFAKQIEVKQIQPKSKGQRKRDAWARKQARMGIMAKQ